MFKKLLPLLIVFALAACTAKPTAVPTPSQQQLETEEQEVYAAVLKYLFNNASTYVIMETSATGPTGVENTNQTLQYVLSNLHDVDPATADSFRVWNATASTLRDDMNLGVHYVLMSQAVKSEIFGQNQDGWQLFYEMYPDAPGITDLSRVGFNAALDQALVYVGTQSHYLAGAGYFILLKKVNGAWTVDQQVMTWIS